MTSQHPHLLRPKYRPDIDGLRAIAVLSVVAFHAFPSWLKGGFVGVDVFFVISGFLISTIIFENLDRGTFSFAEFYARRMKRIFPALCLVLVASFAFGWFALLADEYKQLGKHIAAGAGFVSNLALWNEAGYFDNSAETKPLLHLWSLGIEEQFYVVWPLCLWLAWKRRVNFLTIMAPVAVVSFSLNIRGVTQDAVAAFYSPQTRFWELLSGSLLAWATIYKKGAYEGIKSKLDGWLCVAMHKRAPETDGTTLANVLSFVGLFLLAFGFWRINRESSFPGKWAVVPVLGAVLLISAGPRAWINRHVLSNRVVVWFGLISFPLYLWHWPLLSFARIVESEIPSRNIHIAAVVLSIVLAWLTYALVERHIRFGGHSKVKVTALVVLTTVVGYVGYNTYSRDGYPLRASVKRYADNQNELLRTPPIDNECLDYVGNKSPLFPYCRFTNAGAKETVAVVGDSHAYVAYPGIAGFLKNKKVNTVLLANSGCPPLIDAPFGKTDSDRNSCNERINELIDILLRRGDIEKTFLFTRGALYLTGTEPVTGKVDVMNGVRISVDEYKLGLQRTIDRLAAAGKKVFYVTENPELDVTPKACLVRPLRLNAIDCRVDILSVLSRQKDYLDIVKSLSGATVVGSLKAFCPSSKCVVFDTDGALLYSDDDHLSVAGSKFQVKNLLSDFLN